MQGLITLDFGNTHPHAGIFLKESGTWSLSKVTAFDSLAENLADMKLSPHNSSMVLCQVKAREDELQPFIEEGYHLTRLKDYWKGQKFAGMPVHYAHTLGEDRLISAYYCFKKLKEKTLIIDAGTFTTLDVVNDGFAGGYIIPGWKAYQETFTHGDQLRTVSLTSPVRNDLPSDTVQAMSQGYSAFAVLAGELISSNQISRLILTGGNASLWEGMLEQKTGSVPASCVVEKSPHLVHLALQYWMTTQIEIL